MDMPQQKHHAQQEQQQYASSKEQEHQQPGQHTMQPPSGSSNRRKPPALASALSGAMSGALISACVQPLDVLRTRMQADAAMGNSRGVVQTLQAVMREGGTRGLWRGTGPTVVRLACGAGINFVALENLKHFMLEVLPHTTGQLSYLQAAAVGGLARAMSAALMSPVTLVKTRMEYGGPNHIAYRNTAHALVTITQTEGPRGLFKGLGPTVLTNAPFSALYYMMYTKLKLALNEWTTSSSSSSSTDGSSGGSSGSGSSGSGSSGSGSSWNSTAINFVSGVFAATAATLLTQPTDVVRTRMQLGLPGVTQANALSTLGHMLQSSGPQALLAGAAPRVLKRTLQTALVWTLYEELLPKLSAVYHLAAAQRAAWQEQQPSSNASSSQGISSSIQANSK